MGKLKQFGGWVLGLVMAIPGLLRSVFKGRVGVGIVAYLVGMATVAWGPSLLEMIPGAPKTDVGGWLVGHWLTPLAVGFWLYLPVHYYREWTNLQNHTTRGGEVALGLFGVVLLALAGNQYGERPATLAQVQALFAEARTDVKPETVVAAPATTADTPAPAADAPAKAAKPEIDPQTLWAIGQHDEQGALAYMSWFRKKNPDKLATLDGYVATVALRRETLTTAPGGWKARQAQILLEMGVIQQENGTLTYTSPEVKDACILALKHLGITSKS